MSTSHDYCDAWRKSMDRPMIECCLGCGEEREVSTSLLCVPCAMQVNRLEDERGQPPGDFYRHQLDIR